MAAASFNLASAYDGEVTVTVNYDDVTLVIASVTVVTGTRTAVVTITSGTKTFHRTFGPGTDLTRSITGSLKLTSYPDEQGGVAVNGVAITATVEVS